MMHHDEEIWVACIEAHGFLPLDIIPVKNLVRGGCFGVSETSDGHFIPVCLSTRAHEYLKQPKEPAGPANDFAELEEALKISGAPVAPKTELTAGVDGDLDCRLLPLRRDLRNRMHFDFKEAADILQEPDEDLIAVAGPPTVVWVCQYLAERGGPISFLSRWISEGKLLNDEPSVIELECLLRILTTAVVVDQIHISRINFGELICRSIQRIQMRHKDRFLGKPNFDSSGGQGKKKGNARFTPNPEADLRLFMGAGSMRGRICVSPQLTEWLADSKQKEVSILKEDRKLNLERAFLAGAGVPPKEDP